MKSVSIKSCLGLTETYSEGSNLTSSPILIPFPEYKSSSSIYSISGLVVVLVLTSCFDFSSWDSLISGCAIGEFFYKINLVNFSIKQNFLHFSRLLTLLQKQGL